MYLIYIFACCLPIMLIKSSRNTESQQSSNEFCHHIIKLLHGSVVMCVCGGVLCRTHAHGARRRHASHWAETESREGGRQHGWQRTTKIEGTIKSLSILHPHSLFLFVFLYFWLISLSCVAIRDVSNLWMMGILCSSTLCNCPSFSRLVARL